MEAGWAAPGEVAVPAVEVAVIAVENVESVEKIAHRLRGGALEMGALRMAPLCAAIHVPESSSPS